MVLKMNLNQVQIDEIEKEVLKIFENLFTPEVLEEIQRIKTLHKIEWEKLKFRPFTI